MKMNGVTDIKVALRTNAQHLLAKFDNEIANSSRFILNNKAVISSLAE